MAHLSNKLHTFSDDDVQGRLVVIKKIKELREVWKDNMVKIDHFDKFGTFPPEAKSEKQFEGRAELELQIKKCKERARKVRFDIAHKPNSAALPKWQSELEMLHEEIIELEKDLLIKKYENS